jgi:RNA recognition motif-containing protein
VSFVLKIKIKSLRPLFLFFFAILFLVRISPADSPSRVRKSSQDTHRGFGYVEFALAEDAHEAIDNMDQAELYGRVIKVNQAKPQKQAGEKLGSKTAVWEQVSLFCCWLSQLPTESTLFLGCLISCCSDRDITLRWICC